MLIDVEISKDGNMYCAMTPPNSNFHTGRFEFGDTPELALEKLTSKYPTFAIIRVINGDKNAN